ncbi:MAG: tetratricopeptide repeat protein [Actinomycetota bacterium]|nr:tetratricopeptide repeat protein [Actinomycetota bacterium]
MTRPTPASTPAQQRARAQQQAAMSASFARAIDLSPLANRATPPGGAGSPAAQGAPSAAGTASGDGAPAAEESSSPYVLTVTEESFQELVQLSTQLLVVIDLWATWCEPCKQLSPVLEKLADAAAGSWILAKVDVDANPRIAQAFGVQSVPTVVALADGQPVDAFAGALPEPEVRQWVSGLLDALRDKLPGIKAAEEANGGPAPEPEDPRFTAAEDLLADGKFSEAAHAYQRILDTEPANSQAAAALAHATFLGRVDGLSDDAVAIADAAPDDVAAQRNAADVELAAGNPQAAFDRLIGAIRRAGSQDRAPLREHLLSLFALFDVDDQHVVAARRTLAAALF